MRYYIFILLNIFGILLAKGQTNPTLSTGSADARLNLVSSSSGRINAKTGHMVFYNPVYEHKGNTLSADSGYMYEDEIKRQFFEAFDNVVITQPSGTVIYADRLHYDAAMQVATLTRNVKLVNPNSVLTTNHLVYKMRNKVGTYRGGGRIISATDTITSVNADYFELTEDAYFKNKVIVRTPDVRIFTDDMRYNSLQRMTFFNGPTNIKGNKQENLYTEKGDYNTATGIARFSKNNLYTEGSKFLKGDSLYYERSSGIGKAYKNVVFVDTVDKFHAYGGYGLYQQSDASITMTDKPLITMVLKSDSTQQKDPKGINDSSAPTAASSSPQKHKLQTEQAALADSSLSTLSIADSSVVVGPRPQEADSVYMTADTLYSKVIFKRDYLALNLNLNRDGGALESEMDVDYGDEGDEFSDIPQDVVDSVKTDSLAAQQKIQINTPSTAKVKVKTATIEPPTIEKSLRQDSILRQQALIPTENTAETMINTALLAAQRVDTLTRDSVEVPIDKSVDTAKTRIVKAYHHVRLFKSDMQAVADSLYYGMADSMFRFMGKPMIWSQGSQISADTIYMQILNQKLDNALLKENAFMVNAVLDTVKFNQLKGRKITAFFTDNKIQRLFVDGNAENIVFSSNEKTGIITEMAHERGARIKLNLRDNKITDYISVRKVDLKVYPFSLVTPENEILPGFIWLPQDRPRSKEDMLHRSRTVNKAPVAVGAEPKDTESPPTEALDEKIDVGKPANIQTLKKAIPN